MKKCNQCGIEKEFTEFQIRRASKDGFTARCKKCLSEYDKKRFKEDPKVKARHKAYQKTEAGKEAMNRARRKYVENNKDKIAEICKKYRENNKKKYQCHGIVAYAIKCGNLTSKPCEVCGERKVEGHHDDYDKPLEVRWLCRKHHAEWHRINGEGKNAI